MAVEGTVGMRVETDGKKLSFFFMVPAGLTNSDRQDMLNHMREIIKDASVLHIAHGGSGLTVDTIKEPT